MTCGWRTWRSAMSPGSGFITRSDSIAPARDCGRDEKAGLSVERQLAGADMQSEMRNCAACRRVRHSSEAPAKPPVIQGRNGVSQKAEGAGHASHYFSLTRLLTTGSIDVGGKAYQVEGTSWMDHEFFTGSMAADETGWDWLSVQLEDGAELMLYRLRHRDGSIDPFSSGSYVDAQGKSEFLSVGDFSMTPAGDDWTSALTKASYPERWHVSIAKLGIGFDVTTPLRDQELVSSYGPSYWEGAVDISGQRGGATLRGVGLSGDDGLCAAGRGRNSAVIHAPRNLARTCRYAFAASVMTSG